MLARDVRPRNQILPDDPPARTDDDGPSHGSRGAHTSPARGPIAGIGFRVTPERLLVGLLGVTIVLTGTSLIIQYLDHSGYPVPPGLIQRLDLNRENNIPTWFSSAILAIGAVLTFFIARAMADLRRRNVACWAGLAVLFLCLSVDATANLHEAAVEPVQRLLDAGGAPHAAWVLPAAALLALVAAVYARFLLSLPRRTAALFALAGLLFVGGALALEMVGWHYRDPAHAGQGLTYAALTHVEEFLEMASTVIFIYALLAYIADQRLALVVRFPNRLIEDRVRFAPRPDAARLRRRGDTRPSWSTAGR